MEQAGELKDIQQQDYVYLSAARILYIADFKIFDLKLGEPVWIEFKGFETEKWRIKRRLWLAYGPGQLRIYKAFGREDIRLTETLNPKKQLKLGIDDKED